MISVILTTYDRRALLAHALASVYAQTEADYEVLVLDDGSTDGTLEELRGQPATVVPLPHSGNPALVRNVGFARARGDLIAFLDSDDVWRPTLLAELTSSLSRHPEAGFAYCDGAPPVPDPPRLPVAGDIFDQLLELDFVVTSGIMVRRSVAEAVGAFDPRCSPAEDWDYWLRMAGRFSGVHVRHELVVIGSPPDSLSRAAGGVIYRSNIRVMRKALRWCVVNRRASVPLARRAYRRSRLASARYRWHRRALAGSMSDLMMVALGR